MAASCSIGRRSKPLRPLQRILRPDDRFAELAVAYDIDALLACWRFYVGDLLRQAIFVTMKRVLTSRVIN
jgi:hypothetical protein